MADMDSNPYKTDYSMSEEILSNFHQRTKVVKITQEGDLQSIDQYGLLDFDGKKNLIIRISYRHGHFFMTGADLFQIWPKESTEKENLTETINWRNTYSDSQSRYRLECFDYLPGN
jgi:uncharacterized membrane protein